MIIEDDDGNTVSIRMGRVLINGEDETVFHFQQRVMGFGFNTSFERGSDRIYTMTMKKLKDFMAMFVGESELPFNEMAATCGFVRRTGVLKNTFEITQEKLFSFMTTVVGVEDLPQP